METGGEGKCEREEEKRCKEMERGGRGGRGDTHDIVMSTEV